MNDLHDQAVLYVVDALEPDEGQDFERHLEGCPDCQQEVRDMRAVTEQLSRSVAAEPPASLRSAILARIADTPQESAAPHVAAADQHLAAAPDSAAPPARAAQADPASRSNVAVLRRSWPSRLPYLVAAAAVVTAVGFGGWALQSRQDVGEANQQYSEIALLLATPDVRTVSGSVLGGGGGTVVLSRSQARAVFVAAGMPSLSNGKVYELWTVAGSPVPAGLFTPGDAPVVVHLPGAALSASRILVTVEPSGGSEHPTSSPVMSVTVPRTA